MPQRTREEIEGDYTEISGLRLGNEVRIAASNRLILEALLDIRDQLEELKKK